MTLRSAFRRPSAMRNAAAAVFPPGLVTLGALLPERPSTATAALAYVLAVVVAAAAGGVWAGLTASAISFLALNFFFTPPFHTLAVNKAQDLVALAVFFAVSATVGALLSRALAQRARAEQREREARLLQHVGTRLLSGVATEEVLRSLAQSVTQLFGLASCRIVAELRPHTIEVEERADDDGGGPEDVVPMTVRDRELGRIVVVPGPAHPLGTDERSVIRTVATQTALALDGMQLASEAQRARTESETNRARAALFSSVTHDLRTPLASITASVTSLLHDDQTMSQDDERELLETIRQEAERLNRLVGNLLDVSRIRAGALTPAKVPVAVDEVLEGVIGRLEPILRDHEVVLIVRDDVPEIPLDVVQIDQAVTNVLENAARLTPPGKRISIAASRWHNGVEVRIGDQGPGIPEADRERVFEPFVRGEASTGSGLGLAIAKAIVEAHGGRIRIGSNPGGGTIVSMEFPGAT
jgi:two-component system sensor histidine kinase KdpD